VRSAASWISLIGAVRAVRTCESRRGSPQSAWRARLLTTALVLSVVSVAGCTGSSGTTAHVTATAAGTATPADVASDCLLPPISCYAPALFRVEYGIQPLLDRGIDGRGETVTVLAVAPAPGAPANNATVAPPPGATPASDIRQDLTALDGMFRLPAARIQVVTTLAGAGSPWQAADEEVQDTEIVHTVAPAAALRVVLLPSNALDSAANATTDLLAGLRLAVSGTDVAVISFSLGEHYFTKAQVAQMHFTLLGASAHHVTVIAGSGDNGGYSDADFGGIAVKEVSLPASDPLVLAAGGTSINGNLSAGFYISETVWNGQAGLVLTSGASGGGFSHLYIRPAYQDGVQGISTGRGVPDVAGEADRATGWAFVFTGGSQRWIMASSGTSASASLWGGLVALADQEARHDLGLVNPAIYRIARSSLYHQAFHDITTGSNIVNTPPVGLGGYQAGPGWDPATGWGTPDAQVLVPLLAA
jgi:subtilase family serine protease